MREFSVRVSTPTYEALLKQADYEKRSLSNLVALLLEDALLSRKDR